MMVILIPIPKAGELMDVDTAAILGWSGRWVVSRFIKVHRQRVSLLPFTYLCRRRFKFFDLRPSG